MRRTYKAHVRVRLFSAESRILGFADVLMESHLPDVIVYRKRTFVRAHVGTNYYEMIRANVTKLYASAIGDTLAAKGNPR